jgi:uncharacterized protein GlcG (DUF336 family)
MEADELEYPGLRTLRTLSSAQAFELAKLVHEMATREDIGGHLKVADSTGFELCTLAIGDKAGLKESNVAFAKLRTVLGTRRSSRIQRELMQSQRRSRADYGPSVYSLVGGGVAIFADDALTEFVAAAAFSGGTEYQDEYLVADAAHQLGLYTDVVDH